MNKTDRLRLPALEDEVTDLYHYTLELLQQNDMDIELGADDSPHQQLANLKQVIQNLITKNQCQQCSVYEKQLQKLEGDIRQHIKLQHQLKLYQDSLEQKATENKKQQTGLEKEVDGYRKRVEELRQIKGVSADQISKLQLQNEELKFEIKNLKSKKVVKREEVLVERTERGQSVQKREIAKRLQARTLLADRAPLTKTINFNSSDERKSVDKAKGIAITDDMSKHRQSLTNKSSQMLRSQGERKKFQILMRDKQNEKRKINKIQYRR